VDHPSSSGRTDRHSGNEMSVRHGANAIRPLGGATDRKLCLI
jgi:hypothetical protein